MSQKKVYTCTVCGKVGFWGKNWTYYGSYAHLDVCPEDLIYCCSETCLKEAQRNIRAGKWKLPKLRKPPLLGVVRERNGY